MNVIFVKWGTKYSSEDVNILYKSLAKDGFDYYCYTDNPDGLDPNINIINIPTKPALKVWWNKLYMFNKNFPLTGKTIFFDLDVYIRSDPWVILNDIDWNTLTLVDCSFKTHVSNDRHHHFDVKINSSVAAWDANNTKIHSIWDKFYGSQKDYYLRKYAGIDRFIVHESFDPNVFPSDLIQSYKYSYNWKAPIVTFEEVDYGSPDIKSWIEADRELL
ncbi:hypothetical protein N8864_03995 [Gammaproteobacteria bacterium]|nr:hypothetical protein [Gammaproteobacteria bacterium]